MRHCPWIMGLKATLYWRHILIVQFDSKVLPRFPGSWLNTRIPSAWLGHSQSVCSLTEAFLPNKHMILWANHFDSLPPSLHLEKGGCHLVASRDSVHVHIIWYTVASTLCVSASPYGRGNTPSLSVSQVTLCLRLNSLETNQHAESGQKVYWGQLSGNTTKGVRKVRLDRDWPTKQLKMRLQHVPRRSWEHPSELLPIEARGSGLYPFVSHPPGQDETLAEAGPRTIPAQELQWTEISLDSQQLGDLGKSTHSIPFTPSKNI